MIGAPAKLPDASFGGLSVLSIGVRSICMSNESQIFHPS
jgi:hypothetical protein